MGLNQSEGGDGTLLIHEGVKRKAEFKATGAIPDPATTDNEEFKCVLSLIRDSLKTDPQKWTICPEVQAALVYSCAVRTGAGVEDSESGHQLLERRSNYSCQSVPVMLLIETTRLSPNHSNRTCQCSNRRHTFSITDTNYGYSNSLSTANRNPGPLAQNVGVLMDHRTYITVGGAF